MFQPPFTCWPIPACLLLAIAAPVQGDWELPVRQGQCECVLPTPSPKDEYYLVVGNLNRAGRDIAVRIEAKPTDAAATLREPRRAAELPREPVNPLPACAGERFAPRDPPLERVFHVFARESDFNNPAHYVAVTGRLRAVGRRCQVYVDREFPDSADLAPAVADAVRTFDEQVLPWAEQHLGAVLDVDRDGRFTLLFTPWLGRLQNGKVTLKGCVRGSDFFRDLAGPFSNHCDMLYLNTDLQAGPELRTIVAHEYTHAVLFCQHVLTAHQPGLPRNDEESWLNEGLAHLVEDLQGHSWSNLDYRISGYLSDPAAYPLVVADYYGSGRWREPGPRGAAYLFLRHCRDRHGPELPGRLARTNRSGIANLEHATGAAFPDLFRSWTLSLLDGPLPQGSADRPFTRLVCGPRLQELRLAGDSGQAHIASTAVAYFLLHSPGSERTYLKLSAPADAELQVTLRRRPAPTARLELRAGRSRDGLVRLTATAHHGDLRLEDAAWERLWPTGNAAEDTDYHPGEPAAARLRRWLGATLLHAGETRENTNLWLPASIGTAPVVIKVRACDESGRAVHAWSVLHTLSP